MPSRQGNAQVLDSGAFALAIFLRLHGVAAIDPDKFKRPAIGGMGVKEILKRAREFGVRARVRTTDWSRLALSRFPAIAVLRGGDFLLLGEIAEDNVIIVRPSLATPKPERLTRAQFEEEWGGVVLLAEQRAFAWRSLPGDALADLKGLVAGAAKRVGDVTRGLIHLRQAEPERPESPTDKFEANAEESAAADESGLGALVLLLGCHGIGADPAQLKHRLGGARVGVVEMLRCAKELGLKASVSATHWDRLARTPLPGIAALRD